MSSRVILLDGKFVAPIDEVFIKQQGRVDFDLYEVSDAGEVTH